MTFRRSEPRPAKQMDDYTPRPREVVLRRDPPATMCVPLPKTSPWRCEAYLRIVASYPCAHCGIEGRSQAAHADSAGKGMAIKPPDSEVMPLCASSPGRPGCHWLIGTSGRFTKEQRRILEANYVASTKKLLEGKFNAKN